MNKKITLILALLIGILGFSQKKKFSKEEIKKMETYLFNEGYGSPSTKKTSTLLMKDGTEIIGYCSGMKTKKGQISSIEIKDSISKKEMNYPAEEVAKMWVYPSNLSIATKTQKYMSNIRNWDTKKMSKSTGSDRILFVNQTVSLKNKKDEKQFLMELINPEFDKIISVYNDPFAKETSGVTVGFGPQLGGGVTKSFYVKKGDKIIWLHKDDFEDNYEFLFGDNAEFMKEFPAKSVEWDYFSFLVFKYTEMSAN